MRSIRKKLVLLLSFSAAIALLLSSVAMSVYTYYEKESENYRVLSELSVVMAENLVASVEFNDQDTAKIILDTLRSYTDIEGAYIFDGEENMFAAYSNSKIAEKELHDNISKIVRQNNIENFFHNKYFKKNVLNYPILSDGEYIGSLIIVSGTDSLDKVIQESLILEFFVSIVTLVIVILLALRLQRIFTIPIFNLKRVAQKVTKDGDYSIRASLESNDEFKTLAEGFNLMLDTIEKRTKQAQNLLDHADQGFLSFSKDLIIHEQYSKECVNIFAQEIVGLNVTDILSDSHMKEKDFFAQTLKDLFEEDESTSELIIPLLQKEFYINEKYIHVQYKLLDKENLMLILTDITEQKSLEKRLTKEKDILQMVVTYVIDRDDVSNIIFDFEQYIQSIQNSISPVLPARDNLAKIYRDIHTFKGLFLQRDFINTPKGLHALESRLKELIEDLAQDNAKVIQFIEGLKHQKWLKRDIDILKRVLGEEFFLEAKNISINHEDFLNLEKSIELLLENSKNPLLSQSVMYSLNRCKYKKLVVLLEPYKKIVHRLSKKLKKEVNPLEIMGDKTILVSQKYRTLVDSLVHLFRNSLDHGIETPDERILLGKSELATISCYVGRRGDSIILSVSDDGRGIDINKIKSKILEKGLISDNEFSKMDERSVIDMIFYDEFSTSNVVSDISGRGMGLSALKYEVSKLGGKIDVNTEPNVKTEFIITVPKGDDVI